MYHLFPVSKELVAIGSAVPKIGRGRVTMHSDHCSQKGTLLGPRRATGAIVRSCSGGDLPSLGLRG